jgi:hypothetical protein
MSGMERLDAALTRLLESWANEAVAVRVVTASDDLVAVFAGTLRSCSGEQHPELFWPLECDDRNPPTVERHGIYVHPELLDDVRVHTGGFVVEYVQAGVTVNVRRLDNC